MNKGVEAKCVLAVLRRAVADSRAAAVADMDDGWFITKREKAESEAQKG